MLRLERGSVLQEWKNVTGMVDWVLVINLGGREKPIKVSRRMIGSGVCLYYEEPRKEC